MDNVNFSLDNVLGLPGGDMEFRDVTGLFLEAAAGKNITSPRIIIIHLKIIIMKSWNLTTFSSWKVILCRKLWALWK